MKWSQTGETDSVCSSAHQGLLFQAFLAAVHTAFVVAFPGSFQSQQAAWRGWGKAARWFCVGEGREDNLSAAWVFTNRKAGLEIKNSYGNFYFSLHLKNPQPSEAQALFWVKFLAQSLKMWAVCTLEQQTFCNYLCKLSICEVCFTWGGICGSPPAGRKLTASSTWCSREMGETSRNAAEESAAFNIFLLVNLIYFNELQEHCRKTSGTNATFCCVAADYINIWSITLAFCSEKSGTNLLHSTNH